MAGLLDGIDVSNPCLVWPKLQAAYYELVAGKSQIRVRFDKREVEFKPGNTAELLALITRLKAECERRSGRRTFRAVRAGFRYRAD